VQRLLELLFRLIKLCGDVKVVAQFAEDQGFGACKDIFEVVFTEQLVSQELLKDLSGFKINQAPLFLLVAHRTLLNFHVPDPSRLVHIFLSHFKLSLELCVQPNTQKGRLNVFLDIGELLTSCRLIQVVLSDLVTFVTPFGLFVLNTLFVLCNQGSLVEPQVTPCQFLCRVVLIRKPHSLHFSVIIQKFKQINLG